MSDKLKKPAKIPMGNPYPLRLDNELESAVQTAVSESGLDKPTVMRFALDFGLPLFLRRYSKKKLQAGLIQWKLIAALFAASALTAFILAVISK